MLLKNKSFCALVQIFDSPQVPKSDISLINLDIQIPFFPVTSFTFSKKISIGRVTTAEEKYIQKQF